MASSAERVHQVLVANPELYARALEVLGEIQKQAGPFDAGDLGRSLRLSKALAAPVTKGTGYAGEFYDHYVNPPAR